jgi:hypothetical protein
MDFFTVPTLTGRVLFVLVVLSHHRRRIVHLNVTDHRPITAQLERSHEPAGAAFQHPEDDNAAQEKDPRSRRFWSRAPCDPSRH